MPRLAVVTSYFPIAGQPYRGQSAYQTLRLLERRLDIEVLCPLAEYPAYFQPRSFTYIQPDPGYSPPGLRARYIRYPALPLLSRPVNGAICARRIRPHLRKFKPDLILNYGIYPEGYAAVSAGRDLGVPVILCAIGSDLNRIPDVISRRRTQSALRRATFVLTVSRQLRDQAVHLGAAPDRTQTVFNGCDTSVFTPGDRVRARVQLGIHPDTQLVVFVGRLDATKGLLELLDACITLVPSHPRIALAFIGEGTLRDMLARRALDGGFGDKLRFAGACDSRDVARWLWASDAFCLPSYAEGCPNVVIEALSCGRPVVATHVGGIPDLVDSQSGILIPPRDSRSLAEALHRALKHPWDETAISRKFQRGWDQVAAETYDVCLAALDRRSTALTGQMSAQPEA